MRYKLNADWLQGTHSGRSTYYLSNTSHDLQLQSIILRYISSVHHNSDLPEQCRHYPLLFLYGCLVRTTLRKCFCLLSKPLLRHIHNILRIRFFPMLRTSHRLIKCPVVTSKYTTISNQQSCKHSLLACGC